MARFTWLAKAAVGFALMMFVSLLPAAAQTSPSPVRAILAPRPPMGWNSWDAYGLTITEQQFRENVDVLARILRPYGWDYAVIDEGWFLKNPLDRPTPEKLAFEIDANGRYIPVPARFPSSLVKGENKGFAALGMYVHARGLKFGIHIVRGIPRQSVANNLPIAASDFHAQDAADTSDACPWDPTNWGVRDTAAGQAWYDSLLNQYAAWGIDYLKVDCISDHPYKPTEIRMLHNAIVKTGRPIVLSLSPGPTSLGVAKELVPYAQMWRISNDLWDLWSNEKAFPRSVLDQFALAAVWAPYARPGAWPDADMLPLGYLGPVPGEGQARKTRLTQDEQQTMMTLWSIARSPLILGANLTKLDEWTTKLLTNRDILSVDQETHDQRQVIREANVIAWTSSGKGNTRYLALFNLSEEKLTIHRPFNFYRLPAKTYASRELWSQTIFKPSESVEASIPSHGCALFELTP